MPYFMFAISSNTCSNSLPSATKREVKRLLLALVLFDVRSGLFGYVGETSSYGRRKALSCVRYRPACQPASFVLTYLSFNFIYCISTYCNVHRECRIGQCCRTVIIIILCNIRTIVTDRRTNFMGDPSAQRQTCESHFSSFNRCTATKSAPLHKAALTLHSICTSQKLRALHNKVSREKRKSVNDI